MIIPNFRICHTLWLWYENQYDVNDNLLSLLWCYKFKTNIMMTFLVLPPRFSEGLRSAIRGIHIVNSSISMHKVIGGIAIKRTANSFALTFIRAWNANVYIHMSAIVTVPLYRQFATRRKVHLRENTSPASVIWT